MSGLRTAFMLVVIIGLAVTLIILVPELEAEAAKSTGDGDVLVAGAPELPSLQTGLVEIERTEDLEYIVAEGETLSEIARRYGIDYETLARYNDLGDPHTIVAGQRIVVPGTTSRTLRAEQQ